MNDAEDRKRRKDETRRAVAARLKSARIAAGYSTADEFSSKNKIPQPTYNTHETGTRGLATETATTYAEKLGNCDAAWLLTGNGWSPQNQGALAIAGDKSLNPVHKHGQGKEQLTGPREYGLNRQDERAAHPEGSQMIDIWKAIAVLEHRIKELEGGRPRHQRRRRASKGPDAKSGPRSRSSAS